MAATCSARNVEFVMQTLGADAAIDYTNGPWHEDPAATAAPFDLVVDAVGGPYERASLRLLAPGGHLSALGATGPGVDRVSYLGMARLLGNAVLRTLLGKLRLGHSYCLCVRWRAGLGVGPEGAVVGARRPAGPSRTLPCAAA